MLCEQADAAATAIEALATTPLDGVDVDGLRRLLAVVRAAQRRLDSLVVRVAMRCDGLAEEGHAGPATEELLGEGRIRAATARREAARADLIGRLPAGVAWGGLGADQLDSLARRTRPLSDEQLGRLDLGALVAAGARLPADTFDATVKRAVEAAVGAVEDTRAASEFRHWFDHARGLGRFTGALDPERYEALVAAVDRRVVSLAAAGEPGTEHNANLAADALVDLVTSRGGGGSHLPHLTVVVDDRTLRSGAHDRSILETGDGRPLGPQALQRLACDAVLRWVALDGQGVPIRVGRRHRTATDGQWAALRAVHSACGWPGCDQPLSRCQAHHLVPWNRGGPTDLDNLLPLCPHHHHRVHDGGWTIRPGPDRSMTVHRPDGAFHAATGPPGRTPPPLAHRTLTTEPGLATV